MKKWGLGQIRFLFKIMYNLNLKIFINKMKVNHFNIYLLISSIIFITSSDSDIYYNHTSADDNLYFVFSTFRHGARYAF